MADVKSLVCEVLFLLLDEPASPKTKQPSPPMSGISTTKTTSCRRQQPKDRWSKLDALLFPYMIYNLKAYMVPTATNAYTTRKKQKKMVDCFVKSNISSEAACLHARDLLLEVAVPLHDQYLYCGLDSTLNLAPKDWTIKYRRLAKSRLQACCSIPIDSTENTGLDFVWEASCPASETGTKGSHSIGWKLRRFGFSDADDEEHYWRPWELSLPEAERDYMRFQEQDYKADLAVLDVTDLDWDSMTNSTTPSEDTLSTHSWSIFESSLSKGGNNAAANNNVLDGHRATHVGAGAAPKKRVGKTLHSTHTVNAASAAVLPATSMAASANYIKNTHIYNHHNDYGNPEPDYTEDYSYNQAHPVFKHDFDDDDDLFGVCHGMPEESANGVATTVVVPAQPKQEEPHLQRIIGGDDDDEAAYWDQYDEMEY